MEQQHKRQLERRLFQYPVLIETNDQKEGAFQTIQLKGQAMDISPNGLGVMTDKYMEQGQVVRVYLPIGSSETIVPSFSEVRWVKTTEGKYRIGLQFI